MATAPTLTAKAVCRRCIVMGLLVGALLATQAPSMARQTSDKLSLPLSLAWKFTATYDTNNPASPVVSGDTVYFACGERIYALDFHSGALKWKYPEDQPLGTRIRTTPAISDDMLYFGAEDGKLYALNTATGKGTWLFDTRTSVGSTPTIADGIVYFGASDGRVYAIDTRTGAEVPSWRGGFQAQDEITGAPVVSEGIVYVMSLDQVLHAVGAATGKQRFSVRLNGTVLRQRPVVSGDYVLAASGSTLSCFMARNLARRWAQILNTDITVAPVVSGDTAFVITADSHVVAFDLRTGRVKWRNPPKLDYDVLAAPAVVGDLLFIGTVQGGIYALDTANGAIKWIYQTQPSTSVEDTIAKWTNIAATPVASQGKLFVLSDDGSLAAFDSNVLDTTGPEVTVVEPKMGVVINGVPPIYFEARITDEGSGVNPDTVRLLIDGEGVARKKSTRTFDDEPGFEFDLLTATLKYNTPEPRTAALVKPLPDGRHSVTVVASDWAGNTVTKSWGFTVDNSVAKLPRQKPQNQPTGGIGGFAGPGGSGGRGGRGRGGPGGGDTDR